MFPIERQQEILNILSRKKAVNVLELSRTLYVGPATIRRDLEELERRNLLRRTHGGAVEIGGIDLEIPLVVREQEQITEKEVIAKLAASLVSSGTLILDSSSTTARMTPHLFQKNVQKIITNGLRIAMQLSELPNASIYCTGGILRENSLSFVGQDAQACLGRYHVDRAFFSCHGLSLTTGMTDSFAEEAILRSLMIAQSRESYLLCDSSKFGKTYFCGIEGLESLTGVITDRDPGEAWRSYLQSLGIACLFPE